MYNPPYSETHPIHNLCDCTTDVLSHFTTDWNSKTEAYFSSRRLFPTIYQNVVNFQARQLKHKNTLMWFLQSDTIHFDTILNWITIVIVFIFVWSELWCRVKHLSSYTQDLVFLWFILFLLLILFLFKFYSIYLFASANVVVHELNSICSQANKLQRY